MWFEIVSGNVSLHLYTMLHVQCSVTRHSDTCSMTLRISVLEFVVS